MSKVTIDDAITPYLSKLLSLSRGFTNQALSKIGADAQKAMIQRARNSGTHRWSQKFGIDGKRKLTVDEESKDAYSRFSKKSGSKLHGMENFIKSKLYPETSKILVGFIDTKSFQTYRFEKGIQKNLKRVKGQKVNDISERLENGGREDLTQQQRKFFRASGMYGIAKKGFITRKARPVAQPIISSFSGSIKRRFKQAYNEAFDSTKITVKPISRVA